MLKSQHLLTSNFPLSLSHPHTHFLSPPSSSLPFIHKPIAPFSVSTHPGARPDPWLAQAAEPPAITTSSAPPEEGPIELFSSPSPIFATNDDPSTIQVATSVLLTGAISIFLFRALRRRARRAKELKFRSSGAKSLKEEAMDSLKALGSAPIETKSSPSPLQALFGAVSAAVIALILYKFTTTIEAALNRQTISDNFSVRQITITIRTIINGLCYLATFVFGINSVGLFLYAGQLAINSFMEESSDKETESKGKESVSSSNSTAESPANSADSSKGSQSSDE
ncbi:hypothetical protein UlMin_027479 [Ulmus minor]